MQQEWLITCAGCGYDISNLEESARCPECGNPSANSPELLTGILTRRDMAVLARCAAAVAVLNVLTSLARGGQYLLPHLDTRGWWTLSLGCIGLAEVGVALMTACLLRVVHRAGADLGRADVYGIGVILGILVSAPAIMLPLVASGRRGGEILEAELIVLFAGTIVALVTTAAQSVFLRNLGRGVAQPSLRGWIDDLAGTSVIAQLAAAVVTLCTLMAASAALTLGSCLNAGLAGMLWFAARRHLR